MCGYFPECMNARDLYACSMYCSTVMCGCLAVCSLCYAWLNEELYILGVDTWPNVREVYAWQYVLFYMWMLG